MFLLWLLITVVSGIITFFYGYREGYSEGYEDCILEINHDFGI